MSKGLIAFMVVAAFAFVIMFMKRSSDIARRRSDQIIEQFKIVDSSLHTSNAMLDSLNKMVNIDSLVKANK